jgi:starch phosphorylase
LSVNNENSQQTDNRDAEQLYDLLEQQVIPCFYQRDSSGIPKKWVHMIRRSMSQLPPMFSSRMLRDYTEKLYLPALQDFRLRCDNKTALAKALYKWESSLHTHQDKIHWGGLRIHSEDENSHFAVSVYFGDIPADYLQVQLYADSLNQEELPICLDMQRIASIHGSLKGFLFHVELQTQRPNEHFTPQVIGLHDTAYVPAENSLISWWSGTRLLLDKNAQ